jgi:hypothetical protein
MPSQDTPPPSQFDVVERLNNASSPAITISGIVFVAIGFVLLVIGAVFIVNRFDSNGVAVAVAVLGGAVGVFALSLFGRFVSAEITKALRAAEEAKKERSG